MRQFYSFDLLALIFSLGCLPLMWLSALPSDKQWYITAGMLVIIVLIVPLKYRNYLIVIAVFTLSYLWSTAYSKQYLANIVPYIDKTVLVKAKVMSVNTHEQFIPSSPYYIKFAIFEIDNHSLDSQIPISVYWDKSDNPMAGQIWQLKLKLKRYIAI